MYENLKTIGLDADDTLWQNETFFRLTQDRFASLLSDYVAPDELQNRLLAAERRNLGRYGFGIKGFVLSMIETALEVTENRVSGTVIRELVAAGQDMLQHPVHLLATVEDSLPWLAERYRLILITKGDLLDQERKLAQSGLGDFFDAVEIVSHKTPQIYADIFQRHEGGASAALMAGNSLSSDVIPALEAGAFGVYIPHDLTWQLEHEVAPEDHVRYRQFRDLGELVLTLRTFSDE